MIGSTNVVMLRMVCSYGGALPGLSQGSVRRQGVLQELLNERCQYAF
jgi:hypothetical protein